MSQETPNADRLLLFGNDADLLKTRAMVLESTGMTVDMTVTLDDLKTRIAAPNSVYRLVIYCYTVSEGECDEVATIATRSSTPLMMLEQLLLPSELIDQVSNLIQNLGSGFDGLNPDISH